MHRSQLPLNQPFQPALKLFGPTLPSPRRARTGVFLEGETNHFSRTRRPETGPGRRTPVKIKTDEIVSSKEKDIMEI